MSKDVTAVAASRQSSIHGSLASYISGYVISIALTMTAYELVVHQVFSTRVVVSIIVALALTQFFVQLLLFLHLGKETKPRWKLFVFLSMIMVVLILVFGSLWIMNNLNYRMTPAQMNTYMNNQGGGF